MAKRKQQLIHKSLKPKDKNNTVDWDDEDACEQIESAAFRPLTMLPVHDARDRIILEGEGQPVSEDELDNEIFALPDVQDSDQASVNEENESSLGETPAPVLPSKIQIKKKTSKKIVPIEPPGNASEDDREDEREESWGREKSVYYSTNAAQIDSGDDEAQKLEEAEVLRLQAQARDVLDEADFGLFDAPKDALEELVM